MQKGICVRSCALGDRDRVRASLGRCPASTWTGKARRHRGASSGAGGHVRSTDWKILRTSEGRGRWGAQPRPFLRVAEGKALACPRHSANAEFGQPLPQHFFIQIPSPRQISRPTLTARKPASGSAMSRCCLFLGRKGRVGGERFDDIDHGHHGRDTHHPPVVHAAPRPFRSAQCRIDLALTRRRSGGVTRRASSSERPPNLLNPHNSLIMNTLTL